MANLAQALAEEWAEHGIRVNCVNPEPAAGRLSSFTEEPPASLLTPVEAARVSLAVLASDRTGQVVDVRPS